MRGLQDGRRGAREGAQHCRGLHRGPPPGPAEPAAVHPGAQLQQPARAAGDLLWGRLQVGFLLAPCAFRVWVPGTCSGRSCVADCWVRAAAGMTPGAAGQDVRTDIRQLTDVASWLISTRTAGNLGHTCLPHPQAAPSSAPAGPARAAASASDGQHVMASCQPLPRPPSPACCTQDVARQLQAGAPLLDLTPSAKTLPLHAGCGASTPSRRPLARSHTLSQDFAHARRMWGVNSKEAPLRMCPGPDGRTMSNLEIKPVDHTITCTIALAAIVQVRPPDCAFRAHWLQVCCPGLL